jgi:Swt1-like HEPN
MSSSHDLIRSFGMSGYLITEELRKIEKQFDIELGHVSKSEATSAVAFYPQFEQALRAEAAQMSQHYEVFYCLEQAIRKLIGETMQDGAGINWWNSGRVPGDIRTAAEALVQKERDNGISQRSDDLLDYTTFGQLSGIITSNWDLFEPTITSKRAVERVMANLNLLRGPIAHCCPIADDEISRLRLAVKDWFRMLG